LIANWPVVFRLGLGHQLTDSWRRPLPRPRRGRILFEDDDRVRTHSRTCRIGAGFPDSPAFAEFILGALVLFGLFTRWALTLGGLLIAALIFGTALLSDWTTVGIQMIYAITYYLLLLNRADNAFSVDALLRLHRG
jgi:hypothetical protein